MLNRFSEAVEKVEEHQADLKAVEDALNQCDSGLLDDFKSGYTRLGGEQFRANASKFQCLSVPFLTNSEPNPIQIPPGQKCLLL